MNVTRSGGPGSRPPPSQAASSAATSSGSRAARSRRRLMRVTRVLLSDGADGLVPEQESSFGQREEHVEGDAGEGEDADGGEQGGRVEVVVRHEDDQPQAAVAR